MDLTAEIGRVPCCDFDAYDIFAMPYFIFAEQTAKNAKRPKVDVVKVDVAGSDSKSDDPVPIVLISEALASFFGTEDREMSQAEVLRQMWEYIKVNQLEDPFNPAAIICDVKLQRASWV
ncbi:hypothetical protein Sango_1333700 [Sesamum angolense]|uniref:DM2 domain-containing protein n=1 Tax=Sesamum angolense TaxID=2727404 RepID=A0AAE2BUT2_9LAMI|nr:hypothetical protein Sango_1333700 [Sesamum angolense]